MDPVPLSSRLIRMCLLATVLVSTACYHAIIETGRPASDTVVQREWAHGFLWGLVPPDTFTVSSQCPNGVARVETLHSFLNSLASALTWGIYTPITIRATCAASNDDDAASALLVPSGATAKQRHDALRRAVLLSAERGKPVYVRFLTD